MKSKSKIAFVMFLFLKLTSLSLAAQQIDNEIFDALLNKKVVIETVKGSQITGTMIKNNLKKVIVSGDDGEVISLDKKSIKKIKIFILTSDSPSKETKNSAEDKVKETVVEKKEINEIEPRTENKDKETEVKPQNQNEIKLFSYHINLGANIPISTSNDYLGNGFGFNFIWEGPVLKGKIDRRFFIVMDLGLIIFSPSSSSSNIYMIPSTLGLKYFLASKKLPFFLGVEFGGVGLFSSGSAYNFGIVGTQSGIIIRLGKNIGLNLNLKFSRYYAINHFNLLSISSGLAF